MGKCKKMQRTDKWSSQKNIVSGQYSLVIKQIVYSEDGVNVHQNEHR